jgi:hypothetical protein
VDEDTVLVVAVVGVAPDVGALVHDEHAFVQPAGETLGQDASGEAGAYDEIIKHRRRW